MSPKRPRPLFSAIGLPHADVREEIPEESQHPQNLTARIRRWLLTDPAPLFQAERRKAEYERKVAEAAAEAQRN